MKHGAVFMCRGETGIVRIGRLRPVVKFAIERADML